MTVSNNRDPFLRNFIASLPEEAGHEETEAGLDKLDGDFITKFALSMLLPGKVDLKKEIGHYYDEALVLVKNSMTKKMSAAQALEFEQFCHQQKHKLDAKKRFAIEKSLELIKAELDQDLNIGITDLLTLLSAAEERGCHPKEMTKEALKISQAQKADQMMKELIQEEQESLKERQKTPKKKRSKPKKPKAMQQLAASSKTHSKASALFNSTKEVEKSSGSEMAKYSNLAIKLCHPSLDCAEYPRIRRWKTKNPEEIRFFIDHDAQGNQILRYRDLTDEQIWEQRARHFLPGIIRLLKDPQICSIYGFPTDRGYGLIAQLYFNQKYYNGVVYFGIDERKAVFHKYFEERNFRDATRNIFLDAQQEKVIEERSLEGGGRDDEWKSNEDFTVDLSDKGVFKFTYSPEHHISIFPIRQDLLERI